MKTEHLAAIEKETLENLRLNQSRVLAGTGSPKILVGGINLRDCPNFHTQHMIDLGASIVSIAVDPAHALRPDRLYVGPQEKVTDAMRRLPPAWKPDFFWDSQVEQGHYFPIGLGELDIPTVVSFNHAHLGQALIHMEGMFDCIIRPSTFMSRWGDADLPWGGSWGTMDERIKIYGLEPPREREITVSCTLSVRDCGEESVRWDVLRELKEIKERRKDWKIVLTSGLGQVQYHELLSHSKATVNVGSWGAAMTYRPLEAIAHETVLIHADETAYGSEAKLSEFFNDAWYVQTKPGDLEQAIERALVFREEPSYRMEDIHTAVEASYSYARQYTRLFDLAASVKKKPKLSIENWSRRACAINELTGYPDFADVHRWALSDIDIQTIDTYPKKDWDVCLWQPKTNEERVKWRRELALRKEDKRVVYSRHAQTEAASQPLAAGT